MKSFFFTIPISILFSTYFYYSLSGPLYLSPGFIITEQEEIMQIAISVLIFSVLSILVFLVCHNRRKGSLFLIGKLNLSKYGWLKFKYVIIVFCVTLILIQGLFGTENLVKGGALSNISLKEIGLSAAANYINNQTSGKGVLLTTLMASAPLNYLTSAKTLQAPPTLPDFYLSLQKKEFDFLVLIPESPTIWLPRPDYFERFTYISPEGMHKIYQEKSMNITNYDFKNSTSLASWTQFNFAAPAIIENNSLEVGGTLDSGIVSAKIFKPDLINVTCAMVSLNSLLHSPQIAWSNGRDYVAAYFQNGAWMLESHVNGTTNYASRNDQRDISIPFNLTLSVGPDSASILVNCRNILAQNCDLSAAGNGQIIIRSTYYAKAVISNVIVATNEANLVIYARDGV